MFDDLKKNLEDSLPGTSSEDLISISGGSSTVIDLGKYGAAQASYTLGNMDTITIDTSNIGNYSINYPSSTYTTIGTSSTYSYQSPWQDSSVNITGDGITMKEGSDIKIGGKSLTEAIEKIEERLGILHPNPELEEKWENLKGLRKAYMELEKELLEKEKMWKILKEK